MKNSNLYDILRKKHWFSLEYAFETHEVTSPPEDETKMFHGVEKSPTLFTESVTFITSDAPFELTNSLSRGDTMQLPVRLASEQNQVHRGMEQRNLTRQATYKYGEHF